MSVACIVLPSPFVDVPHMCLFSIVNWIFVHMGILYIETTNVYSKSCFMSLQCMLRTSSSTCSSIFRSCVLKDLRSGCLRSARSLMLSISQKCC